MKIQINFAIILSLLLVCGPVSIATSATITPKSLNGSTVLITIEEGDTLWELASKYLEDPGLWREFKKYNSFTDPNLIFPGEKLRVPKSFTMPVESVITAVEEKKLLTETEIETIKSEVPYGKDKKSRIDFFLTPKSSNPDNRNIYIEVKNTTWITKDIALFPDTVTKRGQKHLIELKELIPRSKSVLVPCITREDANFFAPGDEADPLYGKLFRESLNAGMIIIPCSFIFHKDHITWNGIKPLKMR